VRKPRRICGGKRLAISANVADTTPGRSVSRPSKTPRVGSLTIDLLFSRSMNASTAADCRSRSAPRSAIAVNRAGVRVS